MWRVLTDFERVLQRVVVERQQLDAVDGVDAKRLAVLRQTDVGQETTHVINAPLLGQHDDRWRTGAVSARAGVRSDGGRRGLCARVELYEVRCYCNHTVSQTLHYSHSHV